MRKAIDNISLFQYPGNIIIVDDDNILTTALYSKLKSSFTTTIFNHAMDAKKFFETHKSLLLNHSSFVKKLHEVELDVDGFAYTINYDEIIALSTQSSRYQEPTVLIVDYHMPGMNGLELLSHVDNPFIKKILLTAQNETTIAVEAFNNGLIDKFFVKEPSILNTTLIDEVTILNAQYFHDINTYKLGKDLMEGLYNAKYAVLFNAWLKKFTIQEYYRLDDYGSVIGIDKQGNQRGLVFQNEDRYQSYKDLYEQESGHKLSDSELIYLFSDRDKTLSPLEWKPYMFTIQGKIMLDNMLVYYAEVEDKIF